MLSDWGPLSKLPIDVQEELCKKLTSISLSPGEELNPLSDLPPGIVLIIEGQMRLLGFDQGRNLFTVNRYS